MTENHSQPEPVRPETFRQHFGRFDLNRIYSVFSGPSEIFLGWNIGAFKQRTELVTIIPFFCRCHHSFKDFHLSSNGSKLEIRSPGPTLGFYYMPVRAVTKTTQAHILLRSGSIYKSSSSLISTWNSQPHENFVDKLKWLDSFSELHTHNLRLWYKGQKGLKPHETNRLKAQ